MMTETPRTSPSPQSSDAAIGSWYALWTHSHCEQLVHDQLEAQGFHPFLPTVDVWSRRRGARRLVKSPMFPGYLFLRHRMDKESYVRLSSTRGLARVLGERWDRLAVIPDSEMNPVRVAAAADCPIMPFPYLREGQRARVVHGPLTGLEGILVESRPDRGLLVLSVHLLQRSVATSVDATTVVPA
jgi:transcription termination/antitermination protein NusG